MTEKLDLVFGLRAIQKRRKELDTPLWSMSRPIAYRLVKRVMDRARIEGKQATGKGLRHGVAIVTAAKPLPIHILSQFMGHSDPKTTEIYLQVIGEEKRQMVIDA